MVFIDSDTKLVIHNRLPLYILVLMTSDGAIHRSWTDITSNYLWDNKILVDGSDTIYLTASNDYHPPLLKLTISAATSTVSGYTHDNPGTRMSAFVKGGSSNEFYMAGESSGSTHYITASLKKV